MKKHIYSFMLLLAGIGFLACGNTETNEPMTGPMVPEAVKVYTTTVPLKDILTYKDYPTRIEGIINSEARPKISGYITSVLVDEGQKVRKGQVLFRLETASLTEEAAAAKANIQAAQVEVDQLGPLVEKDIVSSNQLATAKARLAQAKAAYQSINASINYAVVRSPVDGFVGEIRTRRGNLVSPNDARPLTTVTDINQVYAYFSMNEKDYLNFLKVAEGDTRQDKIKNMPEITLILANGDEYQHKGKIQTINSQIDKQSGTVSFRAIFDNPEQILTNGSTGKIRVPTSHKDVVVVPQKSTYEQQDHTYVVTVKNSEDKKVAELQRVFIKDKADNLFIIDSGLKEGEEIIVEDVARIRSGSEVIPEITPFDSLDIDVKPVFGDN